ncbi:unnamed protein product [Penicillium camemberti]|uniref:Str. FM013 n=1 Tax=Penicillium camemberti (strain FM 013) TaxID=1429867 RepID=A0A0G4PQ54_PENC3|nr:unnamed protein product [Penicillium camemberti]
MACCGGTHTLSSSEKGDELSDPKMLSLPGDKTPEEARLEREGCIKNLQVFRYNLYQKESKVDDCDGFANLLHHEEELRRNCQAEISLRHKLKNDPSFWSTCSPSFEDEMSTLYEDNWMHTRAWWYTRGWIIGNSGPLQRAFELWRSNSSWYMHPILVEDCKSRGGCCGRDCGCCLDAQRANSSAGALGVGHCTLECGCCIRSRGFELSKEREKYLVDRFSFDNRLDTMDHQVDPYQRRICLASIWGLSVDDS